MFSAWVCEEGHEYSRKVYLEVSVPKCPTCASLAYARPQFLT